MEIPVLIEPLAGTGYRASAGGPFLCSAEGATREEALRKLRALIESKLRAGSQVTMLKIPATDNPWLAMAGMWDKDDPMIEEWVGIMEENRRGAQVPIHAPAPWERFMGTWQPDDPDIEAWKQAVQDYRQQVEDDPNAP